MLFYLIGRNEYLDSFYPNTNQIGLCYVLENDKSRAIIPNEVTLYEKLYSVDVFILMLNNSCFQFSYSMLLL
jgi:GTPase SAR1 family protein